MYSTAAIPAFYTREGKEVLILEYREELPHTFLLGFVRQHRSKRHVANTLNTFDTRIELVVDRDAAFVVLFHADGFEVEAFRVWPATH